MALLDNNGSYFKPLNGEPHRSLTINTTLYTFNQPLHCNRVAVQALAQNIRFTLSGTPPTTTTGFQLKAGDPAILIEMSDTTTLKFIGEASGAVLQLQAGA